MEERKTFTERGSFHSSRLGRLWESLRPTQLLVASFILLIGFGTAGFLLLPGLYVGEELGFLDALFTATSAVCVTGLIVVDTATYFTTAGQIWILLLIQLGGLGIITIASLVITGISRRLPLRTHVLATGIEVLGDRISSRYLIRRVILFTLVIEGIGFLALWLWWGLHEGFEQSFWPSLFHSISAFCNAGFSVWSDSLMSHTGDTVALSIIMALIVFGGIGFIVFTDLRHAWKSRRDMKPYRLTLHTKLVLATTLVLTLVGWALFTMFEWNVSFAGMGTFDRFVNGLFMSVTARTAGFNTIDYGAASDSSDFLTILLMAIGGSPGSTAGGLKTTTIALVGLMAWSRLRGRVHTSIWGRTIPEERMQGAIGLFALGFGMMTLGIFAYMLLGVDYQPHTTTGGIFLTQMFEAVSAFNTVGLSMGATLQMSVAGKIITIILMFIGRVGLLAFFASFTVAAHGPISRLRHPKEEVMIG